MRCDFYSEIYLWYVPFRWPLANIIQQNIQQHRSPARMNWIKCNLFYLWSVNFPNSHSHYALTYQWKSTIYVQAKRSTNNGCSNSNKMICTVLRSAHSESRVESFVRRMELNRHLHNCTSTIALTPKIQWKVKLLKKFNKVFLIGQSYLLLAFRFEIIIVSNWCAPCIQLKWIRLPYEDSEEIYSDDQTQFHIQTQWKLSADKLQMKKK